MIRDTIIFDGTFSEAPKRLRNHPSPKTVIDNTTLIARLQKKIDDLKGRGTRHQTPTRKRIGILAGYNALISQYQSQIELLGGNVEKTNYELESKIKGQLLRKIDGYFPTPMEVVRKMVELADIQDGDIILEPSAGTGNIVDGIVEKYPKNIIYVNEWNYSNYEILKEKYSGNGYMYWFNDDFMTFDKMQHFDKIIMNPPFEKQRDQRHIIKARECLRKGGVIVAIASAGVKFRREYEDFREFIDKYGYMEDLDSGTFKESGTMVNSVLIYLQK